MSRISITEAAELLGVSTKTLRRWEEEGKLTPERTAGGHRRYDLAHLLHLDQGQRPLLMPGYLAMTKAMTSTARLKF